MQEVRKAPILDELDSMRRRMDSLFSESFGEPEEESAGGVQIDTEAWQPLVDIFETETEWMLQADLPGVLEKDLKVEVTEHQLLIAGERKTISELEDSSISRWERPEGRFSRTFILPVNIHKNGIRAILRNGVLKVTISKDLATHASWEIPVQAG